MVDLEQDKIEEFVGAVEVTQEPSLNISVVLVSDDEMESAEAKLVSMGKEIVDTNAISLDEIIKQLYSSLVDGSTLVIKFRKSFDPKIVGVLKNISENFFDEKIAGTDESLLLNPLPRKGGGVILLSDKTSFEEAELTSLVTAILYV